MGKYILLPKSVSQVMEDAQNDPITDSIYVLFSLDIFHETDSSNSDQLLHLVYCLS